MCKIKSKRLEKFKHSNDPRNFNKILCCVALVYNSNFFSTGVLGKLFTALDSHTNTVKDGVENRDKTYKNNPENCA